MQPFQNSTASIQPAMDIPSISQTDQPVNRKLEICQYKVTNRDNMGDFKVYPFILNGKTYYHIDKASGCDSVSENDEIFIEHCAGQQEEKNQQLIKRLSDIITKGFRNVCTVFYPDDKSKIEGVCHDFAYYLSFGLSVLISTRDNTHDSFYESLSNIKIYEFTGEKDLDFGDIVQITNNTSHTERKPLVFHSVVYIGNGKYISKLSKEDIYIQDLESILDTFELWKKGSLRVVKDLST
ncbi:hypothetical protein [Endozoicomonas sp. ALD040]|uniref:hypothetical protein n=1 Tax=unclassified Endozoicomonas TaxID=2644528 RepID=UPI003BAF4B33